MSYAREHHEDNIVIGAGELWISDLDDADAETGWQYMGDAIGCNLAIATDRQVVYSGSGPIAQKLVDKPKSIDRTLTATLHDITAQNLSMFVAGTVGMIPADTSAVTDERIGGVKVGRWYQLGVTDARPMGVGAIAAAGVTVSPADGGADHVAGTDYRVDAQTGMIQIIGGGISDGDDLLVDYTPADAAARMVVTAESVNTPRAAIKYIEQGDEGKRRNLYAPLCSLVGEGDFALMSRDQEQRIVLSCSVLEPAGGKKSFYVYGEADAT